MIDWISDDRSSSINQLSGRGDIHQKLTGENIGTLEDLQHFSAILSASCFMGFMIKQNGGWPGGKMWTILGEIDLIACTLSSHVGHKSRLSPWANLRLSGYLAENGQRSNPGQVNNRFEICNFCLIKQLPGKFLWPFLGQNGNQSIWFYFSNLLEN